MDFLWNSIFWGVMLIILGAGLIINSVFNINIPLFKIIVALIFIYIGIRILFGGRIFSRKITSGDVIFSEAELKVEGEKFKEFNIIFGSGRIDLSNIHELNENKKVKINTIFGGGNLILSKNIPFHLKASSAFGGIVFPDGDVVSFGEKEMNKKGDSFYLDIEINVVFGGFKVFLR